MASRLDFDRIAAAALASAEALLMEWLPSGHRDGHEYKALNPTRSDSREGSFSINLNSGAWADFATDDKGGDLVSLFAYLQGIKQGPAAKRLALHLGVSSGSDEAARRPERIDGTPPSGADVAGKPSNRRTEWSAIIPIPDDAPVAPVAHLKRGRPEGRWEYRDRNEKLLGIVNRFRTSDGGKEVLPLCFAEHAQTKAREWRWLAFPEPRPLYGLNRLHNEDGPTVLVVEGEKCADAATSKLGDRFDVVTWPGGGKATGKADWSPLRGRKVIVWPDCDAQLDKAGLLLPETFQPGVRAAEQISRYLLLLGCRVRIVKIPPPGAKTPGWDIADAIAEGWNADKLYAFIRDHLREPATEQSPSTAGDDQAAPDKAEWRLQLVRSRNGELLSVMANVFLMLNNTAPWNGVLAYDEFAELVVKVRQPPYQRGLPGRWEATDDSHTAVWLATTAGLCTVSSAAVAEAIEITARETRFNPVLKYLDELKWDNVDRLGSWLSDYLGAPETPYTALVGRLWMLGMVARAFEPGCKFDFMPILEGPQGRGKTTALEIVGGEWFGNTDFDMRNNDSMAVLQGKWIYEVAELDSFNKADSTKIKSFVSRTVDEFRPPYGRRIVSYPRRVVLVGTTNQLEYFKDSTGNRRFWPIKCIGTMDLDNLRAMRDQLFAEAVHRYRADERRFPTREEQVDVIGPEQESREIGDAWDEGIYQYLVSTDAAGLKPDERYAYPGVSVYDVLVHGLKIDAGKLTKDMMTRVGIAMRKLNWEKHERRGENPRYIYKRPKKSVSETSATSDRSGDDLPI